MNNLLYIISLQITKIHIQKDEPLIQGHKTKTLDPLAANQEL